MQIYLLTSEVGYYDCAHGFVVVAKSYKQARELASKDAGDEGAKTWLDPKTSTCTLLTPTTPGIILKDFNAG